MHSITLQFQQVRRPRDRVAVATQRVHAQRDDGFVAVDRIGSRDAVVLAGFSSRRRRRVCCNGLLAVRLCICSPVAAEPVAAELLHRSSELVALISVLEAMHRQESCGCWQSNIAELAYIDTRIAP